MLVLLFVGNIFAQEDSVNCGVKKIADDKVDFIKEIANKKQKHDKKSITTSEEEDIILPNSVVIECEKLLKEYQYNKLKKKPDIKIDNQKVEKKNIGNVVKKESASLPSNIRMVAEFEESQAVFVAIPSYPFGEYTDGREYQLFTDPDFYDYMQYVATVVGYSGHIDNVQIKPGTAILWLYYSGLSSNFNSIVVYEEDEIIWIPDLGLFGYGNQVDHTTGDIWGKLIYEIHQECDVWIRLTGKADFEDYMFDYFANRGFNIDRNKCKIFSNGTENAFWARDWGPLGIYYDDEQGERKLGFMDAKYYTGRQFDDEFPKTLFTEQNYEYWDMDVKMEGGNIMNDGYMSGTYSTVIYENNIYPNGMYDQYYWDETQQKWLISIRQTLTQDQLDARMKEHLGFEDVIVTKKLQYDGKTGHIDLWIKQFDEETMLVANFPETHAGLADYKTMQENKEMIRNLNTMYGTKYRFLNAPMPRRDNGSEMPTTNEAYDADPRGYLNGVIVNKSYIYPSFSKPGEINWEHDSLNNEILKSLLPGYRLVPIDSRYLTPMGGAIHCITMQIPQVPDKLITIKHAPIRDLTEGSTQFNISAELVSNTEANKLVIYWKKTTEFDWTQVEMTTNDNVNFDGAITGTFVSTDSVQYYIAAQKDNEVLKCAPITAPAGYYTFYSNTFSVDQIFGVEPQGSIIASIYPNPVKDHFNVIIENKENGNVAIEIINMMGQCVYQPINRYFAKGVFTIEINNLELISGTYLVKMTTKSDVSVKNIIVE
jgi:agmatine/peptidylarginine deiminase